MSYVTLRRLAALAVAALLLLAAPAVSAAKTKKLFGGKPGKPINVHTQALDGGTVQTYIRAATGGTALGYDLAGNVYSLKIPKGALLSDQVVGLTGLQSVTGAPSGARLAAGVELAPSGLQLQKPAVLTITLAHPLPLTNQIPLGFHGSGKSLFLDAELRSSTAAKPQLLVSHFSGEGIYSGTWGKAEDYRVIHASQSAEDQLYGQVQDALRQAHDTGGDLSHVTQTLAGIEDAFQAQVVEPLIAAAEAHDSPELATRAVREVLSYERSRQLLGLSSTHISLATLWERATKVILRKLEAECTKNHKLSAIRGLLGLARQGQLFGYIDSRAEAAIGRCNHFEVTFDSTITQPQLTGSRVMHLLAKLPILLQYASSEPESGTLHWVQFSQTPQHVTLDGYNGRAIDTMVTAKGTKDSTFTVLRFAINVDMFDGAGENPGITLLYDPGTPVDIQHTEGTSFGQPVSYDDNFTDWSDQYAKLHSDQSVLTDGSVPPYALFKQWSRSSGSVLGQYKHKQTYSDGVSENLVISLKHTA